MTACVAVVVPRLPVKVGLVRPAISACARRWYPFVLCGSGMIVVRSGNSAANSRNRPYSSVGSR